MLTSDNLNRLDKAIDKVLSDNLDVIQEGRDELDELYKNGFFDDALFFWRADACAKQYFSGKASGNVDTGLLKKAISDYKRLIAKGYDHLQSKLDEWENELK